MDTSNNPNRQQPKRIPRWLAYVLFIIVWGVIPWALSLLTTRYGWVAGRPGVWNWLGIIPLGAGITGSLWTLVLHFRGSQEGLEWELTKSYLLTHGPYVFSRNPMYLGMVFLAAGPVLLTNLSDRYKLGPWGLSGGGSVCRAWF